MCFFYFDRLKKRCIIISVGGIRLLSYAYKFYFYTFPPLYAKGAVARRLLLLFLFFKKGHVSAFGPKRAFFNLKECF